MKSSETIIISTVCRQYLVSGEMLCGGGSAGEKDRRVHISAGSGRR